MPFYLKNNGFVGLMVIFAVLFLGIAGVTVIYLNNSVKSITVAPSSIVPMPSKFPERKSSPTSLPSTRSLFSPKAKYVLERKEGNKTEELFAISNDALLNILRWNNLLIFSDGGQNDNGYPPDIQIKSHNIDTGKTDIIFDNLKSGSEFNTEKSPDFLSSLQVIENTLYFSLGGYLKEGAVFWVDLSFSGKPQKLVAARNASISKLRNWYFVIGGEGDSCWSERDFYLLDTINKTVKKITTAEYGCNKGEESLGLTNEGKLIIAYHGSSEDNPYRGNYEYISTIDILNPENKKIIISRDKMPDKISWLLYSEDKNQLLLIGPSIYLYDVTGDLLSKITDSPKDIKLSPLSMPSPEEKIWQKDRVCLSGENGDKYTKYELDINSKELVKAELCSFVPLQAPKTTSKLKNLIDSLNLPPNYRLIEN